MDDKTHNEPRVGWVHHSDYEDHLTGPGHPESPERMPAVRQALMEAGLAERMRRLEPRPASLETLARAHAPAYVRLVEEQILGGRDMLSTGDTMVGPDSWEVARLAAGGAVRAVQAVLDGEVRRAFVAARPPGHHAGAATGMGFCIFNNVAVAARYAQRRAGIERVFILDWDVHHGNGTQDIFYKDGSVFYASLHQDGWYPGTGQWMETGEGAGVGATLNVPLREGARGAEALEALVSTILPRAEAFAPDVVMISAGFDARAGDPLGGLRFSDEDFAAMTRVVAGFADRVAQGRLISVLEGGYDLDGLGRAAAAHVGALLGWTPPA